MSDEPLTNGTASPVHLNLNNLNNLTLTEYTATHTPVSERVDNRNGVLGEPPNWGIPDAFLLPNGYPDVR